MLPWLWSATTQQDLGDAIRADTDDGCRVFHRTPVRQPLIEDNELLSRFARLKGHVAPPGGWTERIQQEEACRD